MRLIFIPFMALLLSACASQSLTDYQDDAQVFEPNDFFNNQLIAEGVVRNRSGQVTRYFTATIDAIWDETGGMLDEVFQWNDGEVQTRVWRFEKTDKNQYLGTAGDVKGAAKMQHAGNALQMTYTLNVPLDNGKTVAINMDDWMYLVSDQTLINVTRMSKFGFKVGEVILTMRVVDP